MVALRHFANRGYAGTSVQEIMDEAKVAKPMLYYYFESKAGLYQALVHQAHHARFDLMQSAVAVHETLSEKLSAMLVALFAFIKENRELVRLAFASAFAAPEENPPDPKYREKCQRNFEFIEDLMTQAQKAGELDQAFEARELAIAWYGLMNIYVVGQLFQPEISYSEKTARSVVELFLNGAGARRKKRNTVRS